MFDFMNPAFQAAAEKFIQYVGDNTTDNGEPLMLGRIAEAVGYEGDLDAESRKAWSLVVEPLKEHGLVKVGPSEKANDYIDGKERFCCSLELTGKGWEVYRKLPNTNHDDLPYGFIAMPFGEPELSDIVLLLKREIKQRLNYGLVDLNDTSKAGVIDNHLREQIQGASFVLAELTHGNHGAYWEAGYAEGKEIPVIYICERTAFEDEKRKTHFDVNHCTTEIWEKDKLDTFVDELLQTLQRSLKEVPKRRQNPTTRVQNLLEERAQRFWEEFNQFHHKPTHGFGFRVTALPAMANILIDPVYDQGTLTDGLNPPQFKLRRISKEAGKEAESEQEVASLGNYSLHARQGGWRPGPRMARRQYPNTSPTHHNASAWMYKEIHCNGLLEEGFVVADRDAFELRAGYNLQIDAVLEVFADIAVWADQVRKHASSIAEEYWIASELYCFGENGRLQLTTPTRTPLSPITYPDEKTIPLSRLILGRTEDIPEHIASLEREVWGLGEGSPGEATYFTPRGESFIRRNGWRFKIQPSSLPV